MGYQTSFSLSVYDVDSKATVDFSDADKIIALAWAKGLDDEDLLDLIEGYQIDAKWYRHKDDVVALSKLLQTTPLLLEGIGEEQEDQWREYYLNGKVQVCRGEVTVTFPDYDPSKFT